MKINNKIISFILILAVCLLALTACSSVEDDGSKEEITLAEPVGTATEYDIVSERNMYLVDVYSSLVNPVVTEYSFSKSVVFKKYGATPGEQVDIKDVLVYSETKDLDRKIVDLKEELEDLESSHIIDVESINKDIIEVKKDEQEAYEPYAKVVAYEPDHNFTEGYEQWQKDVRWPADKYKRLVEKRERLEEELNKKNELYELDHKHIQGNIKRVNDKIAKATITSDVSGEVVACNFFTNGEVIEKDKPILAVGDNTQRVLQTDYISKGTINKALDVYAIIDGKRYELEYVNMEPEEYKQLTDAEEDVYTTFILDDSKGEVEIGNYAIVVIEKDKRENVLCIPNDSVKKESDGYYVYLFDGEQSTYVPVELGMRDGMYAEVISGLKKGDKVLSTQTAKVGKNTAQVSRGDYSIDTDINGFYYYPFSEWMVNPAQTGSVYLKEILVSENEIVQKDQVLATIEIVPDQIEIARLTRQISRLESRISQKKNLKALCDARGVIDYDLNLEIAENDRETNIKRRELRKLSQYSGEIEIKAPYDGIILQIEDLKAGDLIASDGNIVEIANNSTKYVIIKDEKNQLNYGNKAELKISGNNGPVTMQGKVVTVNKMCLSNDLTNEYSLIALDESDEDNLAGSAIAEGGMWYRNSIKVNVKVRSEKNVLIVPKAAVTTKDKSTYVNVLKEDGTVERVSFIPGGSDNNYYWVVDGLTEGMTICWE